MKREDIAKLLGGYATGTLTAEEQAALFAAALEDQELFDALGREQPLRELLRDPTARAHLLAALDDPSVPWYRRWGQFALRPAGLTATAVCLTLAVSFGLWRGIRHPLPSTVPLKQPPPLVAMGQDQPLPVATAREIAPPAKEPAPAKPAPALQAVKTRVTPPPEVVETKGAEKDAAAVPAAAPPPLPPDKKADQPATVAVQAEAPPLEVENSSRLRAAESQVRAKVAIRDAKALFYSAPHFVTQNFLPQAAPGGPRVQQQSASSGRAAGAMADQVSSAPQLGVKWSALRQQPNGEFVTVDPADLHPGDQVRLRLEANDNGYLSVFESAAGRQAPVFNKRVEAGVPVEMPVPSGAAGERNLVVLMTRRPTAAQGQSLAGQVNLIRAATDAGQESKTDRTEHATYAVSRPQASLVSVPITLTYK